jgi:sec-independent protein translocase protein TatC
MTELTHTPQGGLGVAAAPSEEGRERIMTLGEHLGELRRRLAVSLLTVGAGSVVGFLVAPEIIRILAEPIPGPLYFTQPAGAFLLQFKIALMVGAALGFPILLYQLWAFIAPGLTPRERALARPWIPLALVFLVLAVALAYTVLPYAAAFLLGFQIEGVIQPLITADAYFGFVTTMFIAFTVVMQMPVALILLARAGLVGPERLRRNRRYVLLGTFIVAVVVTPSDPISSVIMTAVVYPLYELSIYIAARQRRGVVDDG